MSFRWCLAAVFVLAGCASTAFPPQGEWTLVGLAGAPAEAPRPTVAITGLEISGFAGCNRFSGRIEDDPNVAAFFRGGVAVTEMYCEASSAMDMERVFLDTLNRTGDIRSEGGELVFYDHNSGVLMRFAPTR